MEAMQLNSIVDGINSCSELDQEQAMSIIRNFDLERLPKSEEDKFRYIGKINNLVVEIHFKQNQFFLIIRGSLPKYFHGENKSELSWKELEDVKFNINDHLNIYASLLIKSKFIRIDQLDFFSFPLKKVEFKVDIEIGVDLIYMKRFLETNLIQHKGKQITCDDGLTFNILHEHYYIKIYAKDENVLRFELVLLTRELKKYKILTPADLTMVKLEPVAKRMKIEFAEIIFGNGINIFTGNDLSKEEELALLKFTNPWRCKCYKETLQISNPNELAKYKKSNYRLKIKCTKIFEEKGNGLNKILLDSLNQKIDSCFCEFL